MSVSLGIIFGLITMITYGLGNTYLKKLTDKTGTFHSVLYRTFFSALMLFIVALIFIKTIILPLNIFLILVGLGFLGFVAYFFYVRAVEVGKVSIISPIAHSSVIITVLLSVFIFNEMLALLQIFAMLIIIAGVILVSFKYSELKKSRKLIKGLGFALATAVGWGILFFLWRVPTNYTSPFIVAFYIELMVFIFIFISVFPLKKKIFLPKAGKSVWLFAVLVGLLTGTGSLFYTFGINLELVSLIAPIMSAAPLVTVISSRYMLKNSG